MESRNKFIFFKNHFLKKEDFKKESEVQEFFEKNLEKLFGIINYLSYFKFDNGKEIIDTIGIDNDNNLVIIEYKFGKDKEALSQALNYWSKLKNDFKSFVSQFKSDILKKYSNISNEIFDEIDKYKSVKIICLAESFHKKDLSLIKILEDCEKTTNILLLEYEIFKSDENNLIVLSSLTTDNLFDLNRTNELADEQNSNLETLKGDQIHKQRILDYEKNEICKEIINFSRERLLDLYKISSSVVLRKLWISLKSETEVILSILIYSKKIVINFKSNDLFFEELKLKNPTSCLVYKGNKGHWGPTDFNFEIPFNENLQEEKIFLLEEQKNALSQILDFWWKNFYDITEN